MPTRAQKTAVLLAFAAAAVSLAAVAAGFYRRGVIGVTPLLGGILMLGLGIAGWLKLRRPG